MTAATATDARTVNAGRTQRRAFAGAAAALAVLFMGNNLPSALYGLLRGVFGYSSLTQTLLYAVPVVLIVLPGLLVFGTLSDVTGRRALVLAGLAAFAIGDVAFMLASSTAWLFAGRLAQGLGIALGTAAATQLAIALPDAGVLITQDVLYNGVHLFLGEHAFDAWQAAITTLEALPYETIIPGHGLPRGDGLPDGRAIYAAVREYLAVAARAFAAAGGPADLNQRLEQAFPSHGGTAMQGLQNFYLYPSAPARS